MQRALWSGGSRCWSSKVTRYVHQFISRLINLSARFGSTQRPSALSSLTYLADSQHFSSFNPVCSRWKRRLFSAYSSASTKWREEGFCIFLRQTRSSIYFQIRSAGFMGVLLGLGFGLRQMCNMAQKEQKHSRFRLQPVFG